MNIFRQDIIRQINVPKYTLFKPRILRYIPETSMMIVTRSTDKAVWLVFLKILGKKIKPQFKHVVNVLNKLYMYIT